MTSDDRTQFLILGGWALGLAIALAGRHVAIWWKKRQRR